MPRRVTKRTRGRGSGRRNNSMMAPGITSVPFHKYSNSTLSGVTNDVVASLTPNSSNVGNLDEIADQFDLYRFIRLEYRIHPMDPTDTVSQCMAFVPDIDTQTQTLSALSGMTTAVLQTPFCGVPSPWMRVPHALLKGMLDWYKCTADAGAAEFESQGVLILVGGASDTFRWEIKGVCQFKNPVSASLQMERTIARLERLKLVVRIPQATDRGLPCT
jgi:hypothetical protein